jgi:hypothetical protein
MQEMNKLNFDYDSEDEAKEIQTANGGIIDDGLSLRLTFRFGG